MPSSVRSWGHVLCRGRASWPVAHLFVVMHTVWVCVHVCVYVSLRQRDGTERTTEAVAGGSCDVPAVGPACPQGHSESRDRRVPTWVIWVNSEPWNPCLVTQHNKCILVTGPLVTLKSLEVPEELQR